MSRLAICSVFLAGVFVAFPASSHVEQWRSAAEKAPDAAPLQLSQHYTGTKPGTGNHLPRVAELKTKTGSWITWPGFQMKPDGGSRIFIQTTQPLQYTLRSTAKRITLKISGAKIHLSNNRNPLVTTWFNTPVQKSRLRNAGKNKVDLILDLKGQATPAVSQLSDEDGFHYLFIDFPPGEWQREQGDSQVLSRVDSPASHADDTPGIEVPSDFVYTPAGDGEDMPEWKRNVLMRKATSSSTPAADSAGTAPAAPAGDVAAEDTPNDDPWI